MNVLSVIYFYILGFFCFCKIIDFPQIHYICDFIYNMKTGKKRWYSSFLWRHLLSLTPISVRVNVLAVIMLIFIKWLLLIINICINKHFTMWTIQMFKSIWHLLICSFETLFIWPVEVKRIIFSAKMKVVSSVFGKKQFFCNFDCFINQLIYPQYYYNYLLYVYAVTFGCWGMDKTNIWGKYGLLLWPLSLNLTSLSD